METAFEITRTQLIEALRKLNEAYLKDPEEYEDETDSDTVATIQADNIIKYLHV